MRAAVLLAGLAIAVPIFAAPRGGPPQSSTELKALAEEQARLRKRLETLGQKMELLGRKLDSEGRTHAAELLRRALARLAQVGAPQGRTIEARMAEVAENLGRNLPARVLDEQERLSRDLEELLTILLDRQDLERLEQALRSYQEDLATLNALRQAEAKLLQETRGVGENGASPSEKEAAAALDELARKERDLETRAGQAAEGLRRLGEAAEELDRLVHSQERVADSIAETPEQARDEALADLLARARALAGAFERARALARAGTEAASAAAESKRASERAAAGEITPEEAARAQRETAARAKASAAARGENPEVSLREAAQALEKVADAIESLAAGKGDAQSVERAAEEAQARAKEARERAGAAAEAFSSQASGANPSGETGRQAADRAGQAASRAAEALGGGDPDAAADAAAEAVRAVERAAASASPPSSLAKEEREIADRAEAVANSLEAAESSPDARKASSEARAAAPSLRSAAHALESGDAARAPASAREGLERLRRAREALKGAIEEEQRLVRPKDEEIAKEQDSTAEEAGRLADRIRDSGAAGLSPRQSSGASQATEEAGREMRDAATAGRSGDRLRASAARSAAGDALARARQALAEGRNLGPQAREEAKALARRQSEIREHILELAKRLKETPNRPRPRSLEGASSSAGEASEALDRGDVGEAVPKEEETEKYLEQARDEVEQERNRYLRLRDEELLFKIGDELAAMAKAHDAQRAQTESLEAERHEAGELTRAMRIALRKSADSEKGIADDCARVGKALAEEQALVYAFLLGSNEEDLRRIAERMGPPDLATDEGVRGLQEDVADRFARLREALKDEIRRRDRRQDSSASQGTNQGGGNNRLVPDVAELRMLKNLEEDVLTRTEEFGRRLEILGEDPDPFALEELLRLAHRHNRITELFQEFMKRLGHSTEPEAPESQPGEGEGR